MRRIDQRLEQQLSEAAAKSAHVGVWGTLALPVGKRTLTPADVVALTHRIVRRAEQASGHEAKSVQVYENLNTFSLDGPPALIRTIAAQPEVVSLRPAQLKESLAIEPVPTTPKEAAKARNRIPRGPRRS